MTDTLTTPADPAKSASITPLPRARRRLHIGVKLLLLILYGALTLTTHSLDQLLLVAGLLLVASLLSRLPLHMLFVPLVAVLAAAAGRNVSLAVPLAIAVGLQIPVVGVRTVALALSKLLCFAQVFGIFSVTTSVPDILRLVSFGAFRLPGVSTLAYLLTTTLAVLPSVQRDLGKSIDVAILRGGGRHTLLLPSTWTTIVLDLLVRTALRSQRLGDAVADRGFNLARGLTPLPRQGLHVVDVLLGIALALPGIVVYRMVV